MKSQLQSIISTVVIVVVCVPAFCAAFLLMTLWVWLKSFAGFLTWTVTEVVEIVCPLITGVYHKSTIWKSSGK